MNIPIYFVRDSFVERKDAVISVDDIGFLRGYAVFDYLKTYFKQPFHLGDHLLRLKRSADEILLHLPYTISEIKDIILELIKLNNFDESSIRIIVTGGVGLDSKTPGSSNIIIGCEPRHRIDSNLYSTGIKVKTVNDMRCLPYAKTTNYVLAVKYLNEFSPKGYFEVLYTYGNKVFECTSSNIFMIKGNKLITPKEGVLYGITRKILLNICETHFDIEEREVDLYELITADEVFITSTDKEVLPVVMLDDKVISLGRTGEKTKSIYKLFLEYVESKKWVER